MNFRAYDRPCDADIENAEIYINVRDGKKYRAMMIGSEVLSYGRTENMDVVTVDLPVTYFPNYQEEYHRLLLAMTYLRKAGHASSYDVRLTLTATFNHWRKELSFTAYFAKRSKRDDVFGLNISRLFES